MRKNVVYLMPINNDLLQVLLISSEMKWGAGVQIQGLNLLQWMAAQLTECKPSLLFPWMTQLSPPLAFLRERVGVCLWHDLRAYIHRASLRLCIVLLESEASGPVSRLVATKSVSDSRSLLFCFFLLGHKFSKLLPGTWPPPSSPPPPPLYLCLTNDQAGLERVCFLLFLS